MELLQKLEILADAAKYDVACTSSGVDRGPVKGKLGTAGSSGCCHSFTPDGRCISLLKVLLSNACAYDCAYCSCRRSNDVPRATFKPRELADLTMEFYRRNYIEGLFLSSGVVGSPDQTTEQMIVVLRILREEYGFRGYIHAKTVPGTSPELIEVVGRLVDRMSVNLELPSQKSLGLLAPQKSREHILKPMAQISQSIAEASEQRALAKRKQTYYASGLAKSSLQSFAPAGQSTQMIVGASPESDFQILNLSAALYRSFSLKRVFFSAYMPINEDPRLPQAAGVQLNREHRLYQADWLMRFYKFDATEILDEQHPFLDPLLDPKANWALNNLDLFPVEVNSAPYEMLLRIPGVGVKSARRIVKARRRCALRGENLKKMGVVYKRARYFITCGGAYEGTGAEFTKESLRGLLAQPINGGSHGRRSDKAAPNQLSLFDTAEHCAPLPARPVMESKRALIASGAPGESTEAEDLWGLMGKGA